MPHRLPVAVTGLLLTAVMTGSPQIALASHSQQAPAAKIPAARVAPALKVSEKAAAQTVKYHRAVKVLKIRKVARAVRPVTYYRKTASFREKGRLWNSRGHSGVDMAAPRGTTVRAAISGVVTFAGWDGAYGKKVVISHGKGVVTVYGHLNRIKVKKGQRVTTSTRIGTVGSTGHTTGPHLHFEVRKYNRLINPTTYMRTLGIRL